MALPHLMHQAAVMIFNVCCTVSIVCANKKLFSEYHFDFAPSTLLVLHQVTCAAFAFIVVRAQTPEDERGSKGAPGRFFLLAAMLCASANVFATLSLKYNSLGTYQLLKMLSIPYTCICEYLLYGTTYPLKSIACLAILLLGIGIATVNDVVWDATGMMWGLLAPFGGVGYALVTKYIQKHHDVTGNAYLLSVTPWVVMAQLPFVLFSDDLIQLQDWMVEGHYGAMFLIGLTCIIAWALEWSHIAVVEATSPLTLQVLGHCKTVLIFFANFLLFSAPVVTKNVTGMCIALAALIYYSYLKNQPAPAAAAIPEETKEGEA